MELSYTFYDSKENPHDYDLEIDHSEVKEFLETDIGLDRLVEVVKENFNNCDEATQAQLKAELLEVDDEFVINDEVNWPVVINWDLDWIIESELLDVLEDFNDEIYDKYRDEAKEGWEDSFVEDNVRYGISSDDFYDSRY